MLSPLAPLAPSLLPPSPRSLSRVLSISISISISYPRSPCPSLSLPFPLFCRYYTASLLQAPFSDPDVAADWAGFVVDPSAARSAAATPAYPSVWIGGAGSTTQCHYDVSHNMFAQLDGTKRFRLWPPDRHGELWVFPDAHPRARKAQRPIPGADPAPAPVPTAAHADAARPSAAAGAGGGALLRPAVVDVELGPGDVLFVPAFWFHHVEAISELSVSVNVFSESAPKLAAQEVLAGFPLHPLLAAAANAQDQPALVELFAIAADVLCDEAGVAANTAALATPGPAAGPSVGARFLAGVVLSRFLPLGRELLETPPSFPPAADGLPPQADPAAPPAGTDYSAFLAPGFAADLVPAVVDPADELRASLHGVRDRFDRLGHPGVREIVAAHLLELWAVQCVGADGCGALLARAAGLVDERDVFRDCGKRPPTGTL